MTKGFIFKSSAKSESECLEKLIFGADRAAKDEVLNLRPGDKLFLLNVDSDTLMGTFEAASKGSYQLMPDAWRGNYPYQVKIQSTDNTAMISDAKRTLQTLGLNSHRFLQQFELEGLVSLLLKSVETSRSSTPSRPSEEVLKDLAEQLTEKRQEREALTEARKSLLWSPPRYGIIRLKAMVEPLKGTINMQASPPHLLFGI